MNELIFISIAFPIGFFLYLAYSGLFAKVEFKESDFSSFVFAFKRHQGDYAKIGFEMKALEKELKKNKVEYKEGIGIFFDNPKEIAKDDLRSVAGVVLPSSSIERAKEIGLEVAEYPNASGVLGELPYKSPLSVMLGVFKIYPKFDEYAQENSVKTGAVIEVYDNKRKKLLYFFPSTNLEEINAIY